MPVGRVEQPTHREPPRRVRAARGEGDRLRQELIAAGASILRDTGDVDALTVQAACDRVGCSPPALYRHFDTKHDLVIASAEQLYVQFDVEVDRAVRGVRDPRERLRRRGRGYVRFGRAHPEIYRVLFMHPPDRAPRAAADGVPGAPAAPGEGGGGDDPPIVSRALGALLHDVRAARDAGIVDGDPWELTCRIWMGVHGITSLLVSKPSFPWPGRAGQRFVETALEGIFDGLMPRR